MARKKKPAQVSFNVPEKTCTLEEKLASIRQYLQGFIQLDQMVNQGKGGGIIDYYKLLLEKGITFMGRQEVKNYPAALEYARHRRPRAKECFYNSQMFVLECDEARYFEGFAFNSILPFHHGWVVMGDGQAIDFTLEAANRVFVRDKITPEEPKSVAYLGVEVPTDVLRGYICKYESTEPWAHMHYLGARQRFF